MCSGCFSGQQDGSRHRRSTSVTRRPTTGDYETMITLIKIVGESFDFRTNTQTTKAIVLSNGKREVSVYVSDEEALALVSMLADEVPATEKEPDIAVRSEPVQPVSRPALVRMETETVDMTGPQVPSEPELVDEPGDQDPGVEFDDQLTGVGSL